MSDEEKQLTVAELLERAQANRGDAAKRSTGRRRRRSLEDGGISVAELTGSLSRVKDKPAEARHSSVPIDTPESERRPRKPSSPAATEPSVAGLNSVPGAPAWGSVAPRKTEQNAGRPAGQPQGGAAAAPRPGNTAPRTPAATNPIKPAPGVASRRPGGSTSASPVASAPRGNSGVQGAGSSAAASARATTPKAAGAGQAAGTAKTTDKAPSAPATSSTSAAQPTKQSTGSAARPGAASSPGTASRPGAAQAPQGAHAAQTQQAPQGKAAWPIPDSARRAAQPQTRGAQAPAGRAEQAPNAAKNAARATVPGQQAVSGKKAAPETAAEETAVISKVGGIASKNATPKKPAAVKRQGTTGAAKPGAVEETGRIPRVGDETSAPVASLYQSAGTSEKSEQKAAGKQEGSSTQDRAGQQPGEAEKRPKDAKKKREPEPRTGAGSAVLLAVMGVVLGALVFIGFDQLWSSGLSRLLVGALAVAVTGIMVGVVHALRTARDGISMTLAAVVGFLMTFGPYIPHALS
ncbi:hypothetical protein [Corynebacterium oculi]|uniref:Uncharacterized protein n=1 Tax=Corynebacterium oculi TaxID=1544416 RepID=A0A0Q0YDM4_9CORY|nr:hypothetical protein [Corynebacterium oculi]KQB84423.1 hypothetical protein Cocul_01224 [Corynebacterium oculi]